MTTKEAIGQLKVYARQESARHYHDFADCVAGKATAGKIYGAAYAQGAKQAYDNVAMRIDALLAELGNEKEDKK